MMLKLHEGVIINYRLKIGVKHLTIIGEKTIAFLLQYSYNKIKT